MTENRKASALVTAELAHEIRNVLAIVHVSATLLREELQVDGDAAEVLRDLLEGAERANRLAERLMDVARRTIEDEGPCDLATVVAQRLGTLRRLAPSSVTVDIVVPAGDARLRVPMPVRDLEQILFNLAYNSFDAMPGGGTLSINVRSVPVIGRPRLVALTVSDSGIGMDEVTRRRCLDPFFTAKDGGTGIGLCSVKEVVEGVGGRVSVESAPGSGTTIGIYLPILDDDATP